MNDPFSHANLVDILRRHAEARGGQHAYTFLPDGEGEPQHLGWAELDLRARALAAALAQTTAPGERVLLLCPPGLDFIAAFLGCLYAGAVAVPAYPPASQRHLPRLRSIVGDAEPKVVVATSSTLPKIRAAAQTLGELAGVRWLAVDEIAAELAEAWRAPAIAPETLAFLQYTSGSTAEPKGVMVSHGNLMHNEELIRQGFGLSAESVIVGWLPLYHDMGLIGNVLQPLYLGARCILMSPVAFLQKPLRWLEAISQYHGTTAGGPNFAYELCARRISAEERVTLDLSSWSLAFSGAEPVRAETLDRFTATFAPCGFRRDAFYPCYGLAEATLMVSGGDHRKPPVTLDLDPAALAEHRVAPAAGGIELVGCGRSWLAQELRIVDPQTLLPCAEDVVGEIWVAGGSIAQGYWRRPEATERDFRARTQGEPAAGPFLRTGDLGFLRGTELFVTGRLKDLVILRGRNHYPQDLEATAERSHPSLRQGCGAAFSVDAQGEERLVLVYEIERHPQDEPEVIADAVRRAIAEAHEVQVYEVVLIRTGTVLKTSSGKIQRRACRAAYLDGELTVVARSALAPELAATPLGAEIALDRAALSAQRPEERRALLAPYLADRVARLCRVAVSALEPGQPLSALGLDSLAAIELKGKVESELGVALDLAELLGGTTLGELVEFILGEIESAPAPATVPAPAVSHLHHPLSHGQRALWYLHRHSPDAAAYNLAGAAQIHGELDVAALDRALGRLAARHPALRTVFRIAEAGEPQAQVRDDLNPELLIEDASEWSPDELDEHVAREAHRPFDLEHGPLLRLLIFKLAPRLHRALLGVHHTAADFWSLGIVVRELGLFYAAEASGAPVALEPPAVTYADFVARERALLAGAEGERLWAFWKQQLAGALPILDLPADRARPRVQTFAGLSRGLRLPAELAERLKTLSTAHGATLYMTLLATFHLFLRRTGGQEDLIVGTPTALRGGAGTAGLVGYLVNPLPLRANLAGNPRFDAFLAGVRRGVLDAFAHQELPFPLLVERLRPPHDPSRSPVFQAMFVWQRDRLAEEQGLAAFSLGEPGVKLRLGDLELHSARLEQRAAQFDLSLTMAEVNGELWAALQLNRDLFDATTAERWLGHLATLLEGIGRAPETRLAELPLLTEPERRQLVEEWNHPPTAGEAACLHELFAAQVARTPDAEALVVGEERFSYRQLAAAAHRLAHHLRALGVGPEVPVGVCTRRGAAMVVGLLGVLEAGGAYVPLDPEYPGQRLAFSLDDSRVPVLLIHRERPANLPETRATLVDLAAFEPGAASDEQVEAPVSGALPDNLAYVIYTSGSTGRPKGVAIAHRSAATMVRWAAGVFPPEAVAGMLAATSICFDLSVFELFLPLTTGGRVIVAQNALELPKLAAAQEVTLVNTVPSAIAEIADKLPASVATVCLAGEPLARELALKLYARPGVRHVYNLYGPSEDTTYSTFARVGEGDPSPPIGRPIAGSQVYLVNRYLRLVPRGKPGELLLGGAGLARGYLGRPALTASRFIPDPFGLRPGGRLYSTGDLARYRCDGVLDFLGRIDHQVKVRGFRIELGEIESALLTHETIAEAAAVALGQGGDRYVVAYTVAKPGAVVPPPTALREFLAGALPAFMVPTAFVALQALPLTPNGKLDRKALPLPELAGVAAGSTYVPPETEVERILAEIWCEVLEIEKVGIYDSFFELGGQSLKATRVLSAVRDLFGVDLPVRALLEAPTITGLSQAIAKALMEGVDEETLAAVLAEME